MGIRTEGEGQRQYWAGTRMATFCGLVVTDDYHYSINCPIKYGGACSKWPA